ncbi:mechanosensitive ion channel [Kitasatospora sp. CMC57]|uniref:Mechanosensitive ion channel n=1 Tax=Kitasatospora sp. CMC57 TaxID=3231513 RepID=A0AB33K7T4_9ACTN
MLATLAVGWVADQVLQRVAVRHPEAPVWALLRRCRVPLQLVVCTCLLIGIRPIERLFELEGDDAHRVFLLALLASSGWLAIRIVAALLEAFFARYEAASGDPSRMQRVRTQLGLTRRVVSALIAVVTIAVMLLTFQAMRSLGASLLASAGIIGIVAGIAAQSALGNFFAGLQIAFGDTVIVEGHQGTVEEITLPYLVIRLWDYRRLIVPTSYFVSKPFENWTRTDPGLLGVVLLHLDHTTQVGQLRTALGDFLTNASLWDGLEWSLQVTDTAPSTIVVRATMTARTPDDVAALRFEVREHLLAYLRDEHPTALPRLRPGEAH